MSHINVLVFGATGAVGKHVAIAAKARGANVVIAMRDISKALPDEISSLKRVQADLTDPVSIENAVLESHATAAFIYAADDNMTSAAQALKRSGISHVVLLSSAAINQDLGNIKQQDYIAYKHAQVELSLLHEGLDVTSVRPSAFSSNLIQWKKQIQYQGKVSSAYLDAPLAFIAINDIGDVAGAVLCKPAESKHTVIFLNGPERITLREAVNIIAKELGKDIPTVDLTEEEHLNMFGKYIPLPLLKNLLNFYKTAYENPTIEDITTSENVAKYAGHPATKLAEWVKQNRNEFLN